jgi:hypothetical protein
MDVDWSKLTECLKRRYDGQFFDGAKCVSILFDFEHWDNGKGIVILSRMFLDKDKKLRIAQYVSYCIEEIRYLLERGY